METRGERGGGLKFDLIQYWVRPKLKPMNKIPNKRGPNPFEQSHKKSPRLFLKNFKFVEIKRSFFSNIESAERWGNYV